MVKINNNSSVQLSPFLCQETGVKDKQNGNKTIAKLSSYLKTRKEVAL